MKIVALQIAVGLWVPIWSNKYVFSYSMSKSCKINNDLVNLAAYSLAF